MTRELLAKVSSTGRDGLGGVGKVRSDSLRSSGATAPFRASTVVVAYVEARCRAGLSTDVRSRAILGKYARQVIATGRWDPATLIEAAERFAASRRHPRWFLDWCATILNERDAAGHAERVTEEPADPLANVNAQLVAAGMAPVVVVG